MADTAQIPPGDAPPEAIDPIHDIDTKTTVTWLVFWMLLLGVGLYLLLIVFGNVLQSEREARYEAPPSEALLQLRDQQNQILQGKGVEGTGSGMTIEEAVQAVADGKRPSGH